MMSRHRPSSAIGTPDAELRRAGPQRRAIRRSQSALARPELGILLALLPPPMLALSLLLSLPRLGGWELWPWWVAAAPVAVPVGLGLIALSLVARELLQPRH